MPNPIFSNVKGTLIFAGITVIGAGLLVGSGDGEEVEAPRNAPIMGAPVQSEMVIAEYSQPQPQQQPPTQFASDEELVDSAEGFDPSPMIAEPDPIVTDEGGWSDGSSSMDTIDFGPSGMDNTSSVSDPFNDGFEEKF